MNRFQELAVGCLIGFLLPLILVLALARMGSGLVQRFLDRLREDPTVVDFRPLAPEGVKITKSTIKRLDTDGDGWEEWIVPYQFDIVGRNNPISCVIYHREGRGMPVIYPYKLSTPDSDYLGEGFISIALEDILIDPEGELTPRPELLVTDGKTLSIFRVREVERESQPPCETYPNPYQCMGFFKANLRVARDGSVVTTWDRAGSERSQFALRRVYMPSRGSYFQPGTLTLLPPAEASIEFAFGMPEDILTTPYPEKLVLAFYKELIGGNVKPLLTEQAQKRFAAGQLDYGSPWPLGSLQKVLVQEISYIPDTEDTASVNLRGGQQAAEVRVKVLFLGPGGEGQLRDIRWYLIKSNDQWRLHDAAAS